MASTPSAPRPKNTRPRVLLGVSGSVAAVKAPEIAVRLIHELHVDVEVLLTAGGVNFWRKAPQYDARWCKELEMILADQKEREGSKTNDENDDDGQPKLWVHGEHFFCVASHLFEFVFVLTTRFMQFPSPIMHNLYRNRGR